MLKAIVISLFLFISGIQINALASNPQSHETIDSVTVCLNTINKGSVKLYRSTFLKSFFRHNADFISRKYSDPKHIASIISILSNVSDKKELDINWNEDMLSITKTASFDLATCGGFKNKDSEGVCGFLVIYIGKMRYFIWISEDSFDYGNYRYSHPHIYDELLSDYKGNNLK